MVFLNTSHALWPTECSCNVPTFYVSAYLDDIIIYSKTKREHREHVHNKVLRALQKAGLQLDINKCKFTVQETKYLGLIVTRDGIKMDLQKVEAILQ